MENIKQLKIEILRDSEYNPRQITKDELKKLEQSVKEFGLVQPIVVNINPQRENVVISGHQRLEVAKRLGMKEVPCMLVDLSLTKEKALNLAMNKIGGRYEDTLELIKKGYDRISEIQSSQTALNSFYSATSRTIKNFFIKNWLKLLIICSVILFLILVFWNNFKKLMFRVKLNNLFIQKKAINRLLKNMQESYFKTKKLSESEYNIKLKKFKELIRDIDRQIMVLKEDIFKFKRSNKK